MTASEPAAVLAAYLGRTTDRRRLLDLMSSGHGYAKHGGELGLSRAGYRRQVGRHLADAPQAVAVTGTSGHTRFLMADPQTNLLAWITPHKERRSTLFASRDGVAAYVDAQRMSRSTVRWRELDPDHIRTLAQERDTPTRATAASTAPPRRVVSADRAGQQGGRAGPHRPPSTVHDHEQLRLRPPARA